MNRLYVAGTSNSLEVAAIKFLKKLNPHRAGECRTSTATTAHTIRSLCRDDTELVLIFYSETGNYRSRSMRRLKSFSQAVEEGFAIPPRIQEVSGGATLVAIRNHPLPRYGQAGFEDALRHLHYFRNETWLGPKQKKSKQKSRGMQCRFSYGLCRP